MDILFIEFYIFMKILQCEFRIILDERGGTGGLERIVLQFYIELTADAICSMPRRSGLVVRVEFLDPGAGPIAQDSRLRVIMQ